MIIRDITHNGPAAGDILFLECGDTLFEATITETVDDGVVIQLDEGMWDRIKGMFPSKDKINDAVANKTLSSLGYLIGIASVRDISDSGINILHRALNNEQFVTFTRAVEIAHNSDPVKRDPALLAGMRKANKDATSMDESDIIDLVKIAFSHVQNGMNYLQSHDITNAEPTANRPTTRWGELDEAEYQGRKVSLGKPFLTPDGPKKRSVYVKNPKGNVVKVNFGQKGVKIKKSNPARRKSFRARHNCANPGPRWRARYWSCKFW